MGAEVAMNREQRRRTAREAPHPDSAIEPDHRALMNQMMAAADKIWNGEGERKIGLVFLLFPYDASPEPLPDGKPRCNYISNGADRSMMASLFREMAARFEGAPEINAPTYKQ